MVSAQRLPLSLLAPQPDVELILHVVGQFTGNVGTDVLDSDSVIFADI